MKLIVVDSSDNIVGYKDPKDLSVDDIYRVARLALVNSKGQLLLAQRSFTKHKDPGLWGLAVEGTIEQGETYESNIRKEAQEEIGVTLGDLKKGSVFRMTGKYNHFCQFFIYKADLELKDLKLQKEELETVEWFDIEELQNQVVSNPEKFGYRFDYILETIAPYITETKP